MHGKRYEVCFAYLTVYHELALNSSETAFFERKNIVIELLQAFREILQLNPNCIGMGKYRPWNAKFSEKCPCSHNNDTEKVSE